MKDVNVSQPATESGKLIISLLNDKGYKVKENDSVIYSYANKEDDAIINYNYVSTGIHVNRGNIVEEDLEKDGIRIYHWAVYH